MERVSIAPVLRFAERSGANSLSRSPSGDSGDTTESIAEGLDFPGLWTCGADFDRHRDIRNALADRVVGAGNTV